MINESRSAKRVLLIQALHSFSSGLLGVAIPLAMKARGVEVILMGFIFASMPLIMQVGGMFFAVISDFFGEETLLHPKWLFGHRLKPNLLLRPHPYGVSFWQNS
jgi:MFS family permease